MATGVARGYMGAMGRPSIRMVLVLALGAVAVFGCARRDPLPASHASTGDEAISVDPSDPLADVPERRALRELHAECDATISMLQGEVDDAVRRENVLTAAAAVAYVVGTLAGGDNTANQGAISGPGSQQDYRCTPSTDATTYDGPGCGAQPLPSRNLGEGGPIDEQTDEVHLDASEAIERINDGLDGLDELLFSHPDPSEWTDDQRAAWEHDLAEVRGVCHH